MLSLNPSDFDTIIFETSQPVPMPIAILGSDGQDNHLVFGGQAVGASGTPKKWAYLFYSDAEFTNGYDPTYDFTREVWSSSNLDVLILRDAVSMPTTLVHVDGPGLTSILGTPVEKNMGHPSTLYDFIMKAKSEFPAERYILAFYDHGSGWQGCCMDQTSGDSGLTMDEMKSAVSAAGGVDLVLFTAPCLMGSLESAYQLRDWANVYIGSEDLSGYIGWFGVVGNIRSTLETEPGIDSLMLGRKIIEFIEANISSNELASGFEYGSSFTMSAIDVKTTAALAASIDSLAEAFLSGKANSRRLQELVAVVQNYNYFFSVDLCDFLEKYKALESNPDVVALISEIQAGLIQCILAEYHGSKNPGSHGLTIYLPLPVNAGYNSQYSDPQYGLDFAANTRWGEFLKFYKGIR